MNDKQNPLPSGETLEVLRGTVSEPIETRSHKPGQEDELVTTRIVEKGSGMLGLETAEDSREWSGIFEHVVRTSRVATFLAESLKKRGVSIDPDEVLNTILVSLSGRRQWDESRWYPDAVQGRKGGEIKTDTEIGLELLTEAGISPTIIENVKAHDQHYPLEKFENNWAAKVALYADWRTSQHVVSMEARFDDFEQRAVPAGRATKEDVAKLRRFYQRVENDIFSRLQNIQPKDLDDDYPPASRWEKYVRRLYIQDAEKDIFEKYSRLQKALLHAESGHKAVIEAEIKKDFPENTWWGAYVRELYTNQKGKPYISRRANVQVGIARAIDFFKRLNKVRSGSGYSS